MSYKTENLTRRGARDLAQRLLGPDVGVYIDKAAPTPTQRFGMERQMERIALQILNARSEGDDPLVARLTALKYRVEQALAVPRYCISRTRIINSKTVRETMGVGHSWQEAFDAATGGHVALDDWKNAEASDAE